MHSEFLSGNLYAGYYIAVNEMADQELLRDYVQNRSEAAFAALVRKHINLVYSVALRMVVDSHLAEDVTQKVFLALAKAAPKLQHCSVLCGWLHRTTRNVAAMTVRGEVRRRAREKEAALMDHELSDTKTVWDHLSPLLDDALAELSANHRDTLLLRYFERLTAKEIGERLGLSEDAAQKRTARALDQLRQIVSRRGMTLSASALAGALGLASGQSAPTALAASVIASSLAAFASTSTPGIITLMASSKCAFITAGVMAAVLATVVTLHRENNARLRAQLAAREAQIIQLQAGNKEPVADDADPNELATLRNEHTELLRLRGEIARLRQQDRERLALQAKDLPTHNPATALKVGEDFVPSDKWQEVGTDTPPKAFQSFLAVLKGGDPARIESAIHWDLTWKDDISDDDRRMMDKSKEDYLKMLQHAPGKVSAFNLAPIAPSDTDRTRVFFHLLTTEGDQISSSFEMVQLEGQWKPVLAMGWHYPKDPSSFFTSPMFGPTIDLERH